MEPTNSRNDTRKAAWAMHRGRLSSRFGLRIGWCQGGLVCALVITMLLTIPIAASSFCLFCWAEDVWDGIKSGANWVWKGAKTGGEAIKTAASKSWDGAKVLGEWIKEGAEWSANAYVDLCKRDFWTAYQEVNTAVNSLVVAGYGTVEGVQVMVEGVKEIGKGNFVDGTAALFTGLAKLSVEVPFDTLSSEAVESLSNLQTALFLEPVGRFLTDYEKDYLSTVFGHAWWLDIVRVKEGCGVLSKSLWCLNPRAFTVENTIYLKKQPYSEHLVAHEATHVWQYIHGGGDYKDESLYAQYWGAGYQWESAVDTGKSWSQLNPEQQAQFVEDAFAAKCFELPDIPRPTCPAGRACRTPVPVASCWINGVDRTWFFMDVRRSLMNGEGAP